MEVAVTATIRNKALYLAVEKLGSASALAEHLGVAPSIVGKWLNLKDTPNLSVPKWREYWEEKIGGKLFELTGKMLDDIFPEELRNDKVFLQQQKRITRFMECDVRQLAEAGFAPKQIVSPDAHIDRLEFRQVVSETLETLTPREEKVIKMRFGLGADGQEYQLKEIAQLMGVTTERIRQIESKALKTLRHPNRSRALKPFID